MNIDIISSNKSTRDCVLFLFSNLLKFDPGGVRVIFAIQDRNLLDDVIETYRKRGNKEKFIEDRRNDFSKFHDLTAVQWH